MGKILGLLLFFIINLCAHENHEEVSLQLKWKYQFQFAGFLMAKEKGFYEEMGIHVDIKELEKDMNIVRAVLKDEVDFAISDSSLIYNALRGKEVLAMMAIYQHTPFTLIALKNSKIKTFNDINGARLALDEGIDGIAIKTMLKINDIKYLARPPAFSLDKLLNKEIDLMTAYISNEPILAKKKGIDLISFSPEDYGFEGYGDILFTSKKLARNNPELVMKMYYASLKGWKYAFENIDESVDIIYHKYNTLNKTKEDLKTEAHILKSLSEYDRNFGKLNIEKVKGIAQQFNIVKEEYNKLNNLDSFIYENNQKEFLNKPIKVCYPKDMHPMIFDDNNKPNGIALDYMNLISKKMGAEFEYIYASSIQKHHQMVREGFCDVAPVIVKEPNRFRYLSPSDSYISDYIALATRIDTPYEVDLTKIKDKKIGVNRGLSNVIQYLRESYPNITFTKISGDGLDLVRRGELYGYVEPSFMLSYKILNFYYDDLKIMQTITDKKLLGSVGISKNKPHLIPLFNEAIGKITLQERNNIIANWKKLKYDRQIDYTYIWYIIYVSLFIFLIILIAYIKQSRLKKEIEKQKIKFENIFYNASAGMLIYTDGKITDCNNSIIDMFSCKDKEEILGSDLLNFAPPYQEDGQSTEFSLKEIKKLVYKKGFHSFEWIYQKADDTIAWADIMMTDISETNENIIHIVIRDISDKKRLQNELKDINQTLQERVTFELEKNKEQQLMIIKQNRLAQMGEMLSMIAHQWRQPLNNLSILTNTISLKYSKNKLNDELVDKFKNDSKKQIQLMSKTIDDFRNFFKPNKKKSLFQLNQVIHNSIDMVKPLISEFNIELDLNLDEIIELEGYPNELGQALLNIINNSRDALVYNKIENKKLKIDLYKKENNIYIDILDNAGGIKKEDLNKIYDPYFSTKSEKNGTGLGLYMTKMIIEDHMKGSIEAYNRQDGVLFKIVLRSKL